MVFGKNWVAARGTIIAKQVIKYDGDGLGTQSEFVVDVRTAEGELFRTKVGFPMIATDFKSPTVGAEVGVEYDPKSRKVRCDKDDPTLSIKAFKKSLGNNFDGLLAQAPGSQPGAGVTAAAQCANVQALLQGTAHGASLGDPNDPTAIALRQALEQAQLNQP